MSPPDRAIIISRAAPSGFSVMLDPPGPKSSINCYCETHHVAVGYAEGVAMVLRCPVVDHVAAEKFDGVGGVIRSLQAVLPSMDEIRAATGPGSVGPDVAVPAVFVHVLIDSVVTLREEIQRLDRMLLLTGVPAGKA